MILVDMNQVMISNLMAQIGSHHNVEVQEDLVRHMVLNSLRGYRNKFAGDYGELVICCDDKNYWRKRIFPYYKANRKNTRKPMLLEYAKEYMREKFRATSKANLEADDYMGILALSFPDSVIWSEDKDLMTIPGKHLVNEDIIEVSLEEADRNFYTQVLTGDTTDNYKGCPGVGAVKAAKILADKYTPVEMWSAVLEAFEKAGLTEDEAILQARLAHIKREDRTDLWSPPQETK